MSGEKMQEGKLLTFIKGLSQLLDNNPSEATIFTDGKALLEKLIQEDDWLPEEFTQPHPQYYQQYLLYADPQDRFSVVSFVWGPNQKTPIHNHTVWGMIGQLRGQEKGTNYYRQADGTYQAGDSEVCLPGMVAIVSPNTHDIHVVVNDLSDQTSISVHVYGGNIGRIQRTVFDPLSGAEKEFVSGYANALTPNLWHKPSSVG
jgi:3-mercaptopropionate dioxygenase|uniref:cysteine dioxygenase family protein n=1 Tax=Polynucleobacter sp. TaxID=2029855 RepID=UPI00404856B5